MSQTSLAILVAGVAIAGAVLYSSGAFDSEQAAFPFDADVRQRLNDSESVQYRGVVQDTFNDLIKDRMYCGEMNAKNRMGGYAGWSRFVAMDPKGDGNWSITFAGDVADNFPVWCSQ